MRIEGMLPADGSSRSVLKLSKKSEKPKNLPGRVRSSGFLEYCRIIVTDSR
jgi:hypothetical protein